MLSSQCCSGTTCVAVAVNYCQSKCEMPPKLWQSLSSSFLYKKELSVTFISGAQKWKRPRCFHSWFLFSYLSPIFHFLFYFSCLKSYLLRSFDRLPVTAKRHPHTESFQTDKSYWNQHSVICAVASTPDLTHVWSSFYFAAMIYLTCALTFQNLRYSQHVAFYLNNFKGFFFWCWPGRRFYCKLQLTLKYHLDVVRLYGVDGSNECVRKKNKDM